MADAGPEPDWTAVVPRQMRDGPTGQQEVPLRKSTELVAAPRERLQTSMVPEELPRAPLQRSTDPLAALLLTGPLKTRVPQSLLRIVIAARGWRQPLRWPAHPGKTAERQKVGIPHARRAQASGPLFL